ncbi:hypothetical protein PVAP13_5KG084100 [Panicum virgatum]|uniref:Uncharacterized protein n=1 Tax=Panicum virgatum TaxID=38727 RepID=A0A8T0SBG3_PANVG|nr:hypothetical protein PVAP13_5KG084100 [Panicum virgatum]
MAIDGLTIKLLIDTKAQKVCFAEAGDDVIELLSCLLCLPMGTIVNLLTKERMVGSIGNVLDSVQELDAKYVCSSKSKEPYLSPAPAMLCPLQQLLDAPLNVNSSVFTCLGEIDSQTGRRIICGYFSDIKGSFFRGSHVKITTTTLIRRVVNGYNLEVKLLQEMVLSELCWRQYSIHPCGKMNNCHLSLSC